jgi:hypothetical protein
MMRRIDELLKKDIFRVNSMACMSAAQVIRDYRARIEEMPWGKLPLKVQLTFKLAFVAICHQINWDFLQGQLAKELLADGGGRILERLSGVSALELRSWLSGYHRPDRIRAGERAELLRDFAGTLITHCDGEPERLLSAAKQRVAGASGFLAQLDVFEAYRQDPLRKKSNVLVQDIVREGIVKFLDEDNIEPAIDYHIMRLYLRTGRVAPVYHEVADILKGRPRPRARLVKLLRQAVGEALALTAFYAGLTISATNYVEWQIGRSICAKDSPNCVAGREVSEIDPDVAALYQARCPYLHFCLAYKSEEWRSLREPDFAKSFY